MEDKFKALAVAVDDKYLMEADLAYFAEKVLSFEVAGHHERWSTLVAKYDKLCINAPRDHGKSFTFSFAYPIWRAYYHWIPKIYKTGAYKSIPRMSVGYIFSNTVDQAIALLEIVKQEFETNPKLAHLLPTDRKSTWSKTQIRLANGAIIRARGWGQSVRGAHPTWIVADDCLNDECIYSELSRRKYIDYFYSAITPMLVPGGQLVVVGTPFHQEDLYQKLKENRIYYFEKFPAIDYNLNTALWPGRYSKETLENRKAEVGNIRFSREYLCDPISSDSSLFPMSILESCFDPSAELPTFLDAEDRKALRVYMGVDLALSQSIGADYTVITTIGVDRFENKHILDITRFKGAHMNEQLMRIQELYRVYKPIKILVEKNGFQSVFVEQMVSRTDMPVFGHTTHAGNKNDLKYGVPGMSVLFQNKKIIIPRKTPRCREKTDPLIQELSSFTWAEGKLQGVGAHDDTVMSLWIALTAADQGGFDMSFVGD